MSSSVESSLRVPSFHQALFALALRYFNSRISSHPSFAPVPTIRCPLTMSKCTNQRPLLDMRPRGGLPTSKVGVGREDAKDLESSHTLASHWVCPCSPSSSACIQHHFGNVALSRFSLRQSLYARHSLIRLPLRNQSHTYLSLGLGGLSGYLQGTFTRIIGHLFHS